MFCQQLFRLPFRHLRCLVVDNHRHIISPFRAPSSLDHRLLSSRFRWELFTCRRKCLYAPNATRLLFKSGKVCFILPPHARDRPFAIVIHLCRRLSSVLRPSSFVCPLSFAFLAALRRKSYMPFKRSRVASKLCFMPPLSSPIPHAISFAKTSIVYEKEPCRHTIIEKVPLPDSFRFACLFPYDMLPILRCYDVLR